MERQEAKPVLILSDVSRLEKALLEEAREKLLLHRKAQELERKLQNQRQNLQQVLRIAHDRQKETAELRTALESARTMLQEQVTDVVERQRLERELGQRRAQGPDTGEIEALQRRLAEHEQRDLEKTRHAQEELARATAEAETRLRRHQEEATRRIEELQKQLLERERREMENIQRLERDIARRSEEQAQKNQAETRMELERVAQELRSSVQETQVLRAQLQRAELEQLNRADDREEIRRLNDRVEAAGRESERIQSELRAKNEEMERLHVQMQSSLEEEIDELRTRAELAEAKARENADRLIRLTREAQDAKIWADRYRVQAEGSQKGLQYELDRAMKMENEVKRLRKDLLLLQGAQGQLTGLKEELARTQSAYQALQSESAMHRAESETTIDMLKEKIKRLEEK